MTTHDDTANIMRELERELGVRGPANVLRVALKIAKEAAAQEERPDPQPVDPAWMVEVAREAGAQTVDRTRPETAKRYRSGEHDKMSVVTAVRIALRLALSRGHVVLAPVMPEVDLPSALRMAWHQGYAASRVVLEKVVGGWEINSAYYDEARDKGVSAILENLKSGEA